MVIDLILGYKYKLASIPQLCKNIENTSSTLNKSMEKIEGMMPKLKGSFEELKKISPEFTKLKVQIAQLKEYKPRLQDMYEEQKGKVADINHAITLNITELLNEFDKAITDLKRITFDSDALIWKENKLLSRFAKKIKELKGDEKLVYELIRRINEVKEDMKTICRKLFESSRAEERGVLSRSAEKTVETRPRIPISEQIKKLGIEIDSVGRVLEHLNIDDIDGIVKNSEEELFKLKKIELEVIIIIASLGKYSTELKTKLYLLEEEAAGKIKKRLMDSENRFNKAKEAITKNAESLFKEIDIIEKIPAAF